MNLKFLLPKKSILSLDIGSYKIKGIVGKIMDSSIIVDDYFAINTPKGAYQDGEMDKDLLYYVLDEELKKRKIRIKDTYLTINNSKTIIREAVIPKVEPEDIEKVISFQIEEYISLNPENFVVQFQVIDYFYDDDIEKINLLLIGMPKEIINNHYRLLKDLGLNPLVLDYQSNSIAKLLSLSTCINGDYPTENLTFAVIDIGYENTKVSIIKNGTIYVSRVIDIGGKYLDQSILNYYEYDDSKLIEIKDNIFNSDISSEESSEYDTVLSLIKGVLTTLNERIEMIFRYYLTRELGYQINMILLCGGNANYNGLDRFYSNYFNIPTVIIESLDNVDFNGNMFEYINSIGALVRR
ncbi:pilus assembly protein PilM [Tepidimicrobium xylanilyticum]|uniref:Type IV pilus assembly protein PilM n=1 Tax=Tepidimicrobium xylanilyticum TaxID=1123352 RepID=A0A1H3CQ73_9FIRM|nr:pilus assembly protein PilM [Tepidimicrobium xylanilyticum]GMG97695.1 hypothetical protein EN5CB1_25210 [Tepidimicrobium xylanilyticum]SDX55714.1 type IV pilus assembly protein PilM [Tepidimicrobium xylanilyticum]